MPIYQYQCDECGFLFDRLMKLSDPDPQTCPECGASEPRRTIAQTAFQLKGEGWYVTDYKAKSPGVSTSSREESESATSEKASGESPAKSATDSETSAAAPEAPKPAPTKAEGVA